MQFKATFLEDGYLLYYIEENHKYLQFLEKLFSENSKEKFLFQTSVITLIEVLIYPMRQKEYQLVKKYQNILCNSPTIDIFEINAEIAINAAQYRARYGLKTPDSIQVATAVNANADFFLTNDIKLKSIKEIEILILDEIIKRS